MFDDPMSNKRPSSGREEYLDNVRRDQRRRKRERAIVRAMAVSPTLRKWGLLTSLLLIFPVPFVMVMMGSWMHLNSNAFSLLFFFVLVVAGMGLGGIGMWIKALFLAKIGRVIKDDDENE